jgi:hypothetical protein
MPVSGINFDIKAAYVKNTPINFWGKLCQLY